jgi:heptaprenyl diphosphate synthase
MLELAEFLSGVNARLIDVTGHKSKFVADVAQHLLLSGGKRVRPTLVYYGSLFADNPQDTDISALTNAAVAVELCHLGSLYHDDIMDASEFRHKVPAVHIKYGEDIGIIAGDMLFAQSAMLGNTLQKQASTVLSSAFFRMCEGQMNETVLEKGEKIHASMTANPHTQGNNVNNSTKTYDFSELDEYITVASGKTSALFSASLAMGAIIAATDDETVKSLTVYAEYFGIAYQIIDDILDVVGESGKSQGLDIKGDVQSVIVTLLKQKARNLTATADEQKAVKILQSPDLTAENISDVLHLMSKSAVIDDARALAKHYTSIALASIAPLVAHNVGYETLTDFAGKMLSRVV